MSTVIHSKIAGVSFCSGYPGNLHRLHSIIESTPDLRTHDSASGVPVHSDERQRGEQLTAVLIRNPDNEYDSNAVEVHVPALGETDGMVGHLPRNVAGRVAPMLDRGDPMTAEIEARIAWEHADRPGADVIITVHDPED